MPQVTMKNIGYNIINTKITPPSQNGNQPNIVRQSNSLVIQFMCVQLMTITAQIVFNYDIIYFRCLGECDQSQPKLAYLKNEWWNNIQARSDNLRKEKITSCF